MSIKKTVMIVVLISAIFVGVNFMVVQAYEPLVRLPGLPTTGDITLSQYIVGLYNFLLSIVGIVAVMMLIIGGMKYITAAGNASVIGDAKDTIWNAIFGLLLALLSWVIVSTINPDVLYIKAPATGLIDPYRSDLGSCGNYDDVTPSCICNDGFSVTSPAVPANEDDCDTACENNVGVFNVTANPPVDNCTCQDGTVYSASNKDICNTQCQEIGHCSTTEKQSCIEYGSAVDENDELFDGNCYCVDGTPIVPAVTDPPTSCQTTCANNCGWDFLVVRANIDGETEEISGGDTYYILDSEESQLWDMFLTNNGGWGAFDITATSYNDGANDYDCAILVTARATTVILGVTLIGDYRNIFWVLPGTIIHDGASSLEKDLCDKYAQCCYQIALNPSCKLDGGLVTPGCDFNHTSACAISEDTSGSQDVPLAYRGASRLFNAKYLGGIQDRCGDENPGTDIERSCSYALLNTEYRPKGNLLCSPTSGKWVSYGND